jgi:hypothetical protein
MTQMRLTVHTPQSGGVDWRWRADIKVIQQTGVLQVLADCPQPIRAFGMTRLHFVQQAVFMAVVEQGHAGQRTSK